MTQAISLSDLRKPSPANPNILSSYNDQNSFAPANQHQAPMMHADNNPIIKLGFDTVQGFAALERLGSLFAASTIVPQDFRNNPANCTIALDIAFRLTANPLMVMQNMYVVNGRPGWASTFLIAMFNRSGKFTPINYQFVGRKGYDDYGCMATTRIIGRSEIISGPTVTIGMAKAEGWCKPMIRRNGGGTIPSKWETMPDLMLRYRAAAFLIRTVAPEIAMGLLTKEECEDIDDGNIQANTILPAASTSSEPASTIAPEEPEPIQEQQEQKPKRHRRTKAEMEAARAAEAAKAQAQEQPQEVEVEQPASQPQQPASPQQAPQQVKPQQSQPISEQLSEDDNVPPWEQEEPAPAPSVSQHIPLSAQIDDLCDDMQIHRQVFNAVAQRYAEVTGKTLEDGYMYFLQNPNEIKPRYQQMMHQ